MAFTKHVDLYFALPLVGIAIACILTVVGWKLNASSANWLLVLAWILFVGSAFRLILGHAEAIPSALWAMLVGVALGMPMYYLLWTRPKPTTSPVAQSPALPPTIHDLFTKDFSQYMSAGRTLDVGSAGRPNQVKIEFKDFFNFAEQSEFLAVYVPKFNDCFGVCRFVASNCKNQIKEIHAMGKAQMSTPGDTTPVSTDDLVFSGRVFIYYEDDLSLEQLGVLEQEFKANGLSPQFRGQQYATTVWLQSGFKPPLSIPDKSAP